MGEQNTVCGRGWGNPPALLGLFLLVCAGPCFGQGYECIESLPTVLFDTSSNCASQPSIDRVFSTDPLRWAGHDYLLTNIGNELRTWRIDNPQAPVLVGESHFNVGNMGDSDYDLLNFSVCDDCRWGVANYKLGTVLFDLGTGAEPDFLNRQIYNEANLVPGAFTFSVDGTQYLMANTLVDECAGGDSALYEISGTGESDLQRVGCVDADGVFATQIIGGHHVGNHLYLGDKTTRVFLFEIQDWGSTISVHYVSTPMLAYMARGEGLAVDKIAGVAVETNNSGMTVWDISDPGNPVVKATVEGVYNRAALSYPFALVARKGFKHSEETYDLSSITNPQPLHQSFWDASNPFNYPDHQCVEIQGGSFSPDGSTLYLSRYSVLQMVDMAACEPAAPVAEVAVSPAPAFPGDTVAVVDASFGQIDRWALWVTDSSDPDGTVLAGSSTLDDGNPTVLDFLLDGDLSTSEEFWAHVVVESDLFPYVPGVTVDQINSREIEINRSPQVAISHLPALPITGDLLNLGALAEGHPANPTGGDVFLWTVTPPSAAVFDDNGQLITVMLAESGAWAFDLAVVYEHQSAAGGPYVAGAELDLEVWSVAADFTISPANPATDEQLVLDAGSSRMTVAATPSYLWEVSGATTWSGCANAEVCTIPADSLNPGLHHFTLTLSNTNNGDVSVKTIDLEVLQPVHVEFNWQPNPPEIGELVLFQITDLSAVERATWDFFEEGCNGFPQVYMCTPPFTDCLQAAHRFNSSGAKQVSLVVEVGGASYGPVVHTVNVQPTGSCPGTCIYNIDQTSASYGPNGGSGSVNVGTTAGCPWTATTSEWWITITAVNDGSGPGSVSYDVAANPGEERSGTVLIAGRTHVVNQVAGEVNDVWEWVAGGGFGTASNQASAMVVFDRELYLGTRNEVGGCQLWRSADGVDWEQVAGIGFGDDNNSAASSMAVLADTLYVGTRNQVSGCEIWSTTNGVSWTQVGSDGLGDPGNIDAEAMVVHDGELFVGTVNHMDRAEVWKSGDGSTWSQVNNNGFGHPDATRVTAMVAFEGDLYAVVNGLYGLRIHRYGAGTTWSQVGVDGFGDFSNESAGAMAGLDSYLFLGTVNPDGGAEVWRSNGGDTWQQSNQDGFAAGPFNSAVTTMVVMGNELFAGTANSVTGSQVWRFDDSGEWLQSNLDGFGETTTSASTASAAFLGAVYVGTESSSGLELWRSIRDELFADGFETGDSSAWTATIP